MKLLKSAAKRFLSGTIALSMIAIPTTIANAGTNISCLDSTNNEITSNFNGSDNQIITSNEPQKQIALSASNSDVQKVSTEDGFEFEISQGIATLTKYSGQAKNVVIPSKVNGYTVAVIGEKAFDNCYSLTGVTIPNSVISIGSDAFSRCVSLKSITIPNSVKRIENNTFLFCSSLTSVTIPNSITSIGNYAFYGCLDLTGVAIPNSVTSIGSLAFYDCVSLTSITIPNSVTSIGGAAFQNCRSVTNVTIPNSVKRIENNTFLFCKSLKSITIPNSVTVIGSNAFGNCSLLTNINVSSENNNYSSTNGVLFNKDKTELICCPSGKSGMYKIPNSVIKIKSAAFYCSSLTSVTIPNSVKEIEEQAFRICNLLTDINVSSENNSYSSVNGVLFNKEKTNLIYCPEGKKGVYKIPNNVKKIGKDAFYSCSSLTSITIPNSVKEIEESAFKKCSSLTSVIISNSVTEIGDSVFWDCSSLTSIIIPNSAKRIGNRAFEGCSSLTSVIISNSVTEIGEYAFLDCSSLTSIIIPNSVKKIGKRSFFGCSSLTSVTIPSSVTEINESAVGYKYNDQNYKLVLVPDIAIYGVRGSAAEKYANENNIQFKAITPLTNISTISANNIVSGNTITFTGKASGGISSYQYRFAAKHSTDSKYTVLKDYNSPATSFVWKPKKTGTYTVLIRVKDKTGDIASKTYTITVKTPLANNSTISLNTIVIGDTIKFTGNASGGTSSYQYRFAAKHNTDSKYTILKDYKSTATSFVWKPKKTGTYSVLIRVKDKTGTIASKTYTLKVDAPLVNNSTISAKDIVKGDTIKFTGNASGGTSSYQYRFAAKHSTESKYTILKDYKSTATSFVWKPRKTGTYSVLIRVKDKTGKVASKTYTLTVDAPLVNNSIISSNTAVVGETVLIAARVSGGTAPCKTAYYFKKSTDTKWASLVMGENDYTTLSNVYFEPKEAANYNICINIIDAKGRIAKKYFTLTVKAPLANS